MAEEKPEPTEKTPKGYEVPVPERSEFFASLKKVAEPNRKKSGPVRRPRKK
jgi:hypothetical protein